MRIGLPVEGQIIQIDLLNENRDRFKKRHRFLAGARLLAFVERVFDAPDFRAVTFRAVILRVVVLREAAVLALLPALEAFFATPLFFATLRFFAALRFCATALF